MLLDSFRLYSDTRRFYLILGCLILAAWAFLVAWQKSAYAEMLSHEVIGDHAIPAFLRLAGFLLGWFLMLVAMMLPGSLPQLNRSLQPLRYRKSGSWLAGLTILGYLFPWVLFGLLVYAGDGLLHHLMEPEAPLGAFSGWIAPAIVLIAGFYQFTPIKHSSVRDCRTSTARFQGGYLEKPLSGRAFHQGIRLGISCLGSCWPLMLLMFAVGHNRLDWMLVLGGIMAADRLTPWGHRLAWLVGSALVIWGTLWVLGLQISRV